MRTICGLLLTSSILLAPVTTHAAIQNAPGAEQAEAVERAFRESVRPFLETYCVTCHKGDKPKGDLNLDAFTTADSVAADLARWALVQEQLDLEIMPPRKAERHPPAEARGQILAWIDAVRTLEATRHAGDPGRVLARRLSNAEYDNTIRDLTGVDLRPTREFPVDPANEAGFDNSAESLAMSPSLVKKYLDAAREISDHLVLTPDGIRFAPYPMLADTDRDKYCVQQIIHFYNRQRTDYADYFLAAWRFRHREALGSPTITLAELARQDGLSARYLTTIWATLTDQGEQTGPIAALQVLWRDLPPPDAKTPTRPNPAVSGCATSCRPARAACARGQEHDGAGRSATARNRSCSGRTARYVQNRMRYAGGGSKVQSKLLTPESASTPVATGRRRGPPPIRAGVRAVLPDIPRHLLRLGAGESRISTRSRNGTTPAGC